MAVGRGDPVNRVAVPVAKKAPTKPLSNREAAEPINKKPPPKTPVKTPVKKPVSNREAAEPVNKPKVVAKPLPPPPPRKAPAPKVVSTRTEVATRRTAAEPNQRRVSVPVKQAPARPVSTVQPRPGAGPNPRGEPVNRRVVAPVYAPNAIVAGDRGVKADGVSRATSAIQARADVARAQIQGRVSRGEALRIDRDKRGAGSIDTVKAADPAGLRKIMEEQAERQRKSSGRLYDYRLVNRAADKYVDYAMDLRDRTEAKIKELNKLGASKKKEDWIKGKKILDSPAFKKLFAEYERVHGKFGSDKEGEAHAFWTTYAKSSAIQADFAAGVFNKYSKEQQIMRAYSGNNAALTQDIKNKGDLRENHGMIQEQYEDQNGALRTRWRAKTSQDVLNEKRLEVERQTRAAYAQKLKGITAQNQALKRYGVFDGDEVRENQALVKMAKHQLALGITDQQLQGPDAAKNIERVVDAALLEWDVTHRPAFLAGVKPGVSGSLADAGKSYRAQRAKFEKDLFSSYRTQRRSPLEQVFALPGIREANAALGYGLGSIGSAWREATAGIGEIQTPDIDITSFDITKGGNFEKVFSAKPNTVLGFGIDTSETTKARLKKEQDEFIERLNTARRTGDNRGILEAVSEYGSDPVGGSLGNVAFNALDPLNVIPLNFLRYPARISRAIEATRTTSSLLRKPIAGVGGFLEDLSKLRRSEFLTERLDAVKKQMATKDPPSMETVVSRLNDGLEGLPKKQADKVMAARLEFLGIKKSSIEARQLASLTQEVLGPVLARAGVLGETRLERGAASAAGREAVRKTEEATRQAGDLAVQKKLRDAAATLGKKARAARGAAAGIRRTGERPYKRKPAASLPAPARAAAARTPAPPTATAKKAAPAASAGPAPAPTVKKVVPAASPPASSPSSSAAPAAPPAAAAPHSGQQYAADNRAAAKQMGWSEPEIVARDAALKKANYPVAILKDGTEVELNFLGGRMPKAGVGESTRSYMAADGDLLDEAIVIGVREKGGAVLWQRTAAARVVSPVREGATPATAAGRAEASAKGAAAGGAEEAARRRAAPEPEQMTKEEIEAKYGRDEDYEQGDDVADVDSEEYWDADVRERARAHAAGEAVDEGPNMEWAPGGEPDWAGLGALDRQAPASAPKRAPDAGPEPEWAPLAKLNAAQRTGRIRAFNDANEVSVRLADGTVVKGRADAAKVLDDAVEVFDGGKQRWRAPEPERVLAPEPPGRPHGTTTDKPPKESEFVPDRRGAPAWNRPANPRTVREQYKARKNKKDQQRWDEYRARAGIPPRKTERVVDRVPDPIRQVGSDQRTRSSLNGAPLYHGPAPLRDRTLRNNVADLGTPAAWAVDAQHLHRGQPGPLPPGVSTLGSAEILKSVPNPAGVMDLAREMGATSVFAVYADGTRKRFPVTKVSETAGVVWADPGAFDVVALIIGWPKRTAAARRQGVTSRAENGVVVWHTDAIEGLKGFRGGTRNPRRLLDKEYGRSMVRATAHSDDEIALRRVERNQPSVEVRNATPAGRLRAAPPPVRGTRQVEGPELGPKVPQETVSPGPAVGGKAAPGNDQFFAPDGNLHRDTAGPVAPGTPTFRGIEIVRGASAPVRVFGMYGQLGAKTVFGVRPNGEIVNLGTTPKMTAAVLRQRHVAVGVQWADGSRLILWEGITPGKPLVLGGQAKTPDVSKLSGVKGYESGVPPAGFEAQAGEAQYQHSLKQQAEADAAQAHPFDPVSGISDPSELADRVRKAGGRAFGVRSGGDVQSITQRQMRSPSFADGFDALGITYPGVGKFGDADWVPGSTAVLWVRDRPATGAGAVLPPAPSVSDRVRPATTTVGERLGPSGGRAAQGPKPVEAGVKVVSEGRVVPPGETLSVPGRLPGAASFRVGERLPVVPKVSFAPRPGLRHQKDIAARQKAEAAAARLARRSTARGLRNPGVPRRLVPPPAVTPAHVPPRMRAGRGGIKQSNARQAAAAAGLPPPPGAGPGPRASGGPKAGPAPGGKGAPPRRRMSWFERHAKLSEEAWLVARQRYLEKGLRSGFLSPAGMVKAQQQLDIILEAQAAIKMFRPGAARIRRQATARRIGSEAAARYGSDAEKLLPEARVGYHAMDERQIRVEQARDYRRQVLGGYNAIDHGTTGTMPYDVFVGMDKDIRRGLRWLGRKKSTGALKTGSGGKATPTTAPTPVVRDVAKDIVEMKQMVAKKWGYTVEQYDEASQVLATGMVKGNSTRGILDRIKTNGRSFLDERRDLVPLEARSLLRKIAMQPKMRGATATRVFEEFRLTHTYEGQVYVRPDRTPFQIRTLEAGFEHLTGTKINDPNVGQVLRREGGVRPSFSDRGSYTKYMVEIGEWSPRTAQQFLEGEAVWSIQEEALFFKARYDEVPPWADAAELDKRGFFDDGEAHAEVQREIGGFNGDQVRGHGMEGPELRTATAFGWHDPKDPTKGIKERADWEAERRYMAERYGDIVLNPDGSFKRIPWLMNKDEFSKYSADLARRGIKPARGLVDAKRLPALQKAIEQAIQRHWDKVEEFQKAGKTFDSNMYVEFAENLVNDLLADKNWMPWYARQRGTPWQRALSLYSLLVRGSVVWSPAFLAINVPDTLIKSAYFRFTRRGIMSDATELAKERAFELVDPKFSAYYEASSRRGIDRVKRAQSTMSAPNAVLGVAEAGLNAPAAVGHMLEINRKRALASKLWQSAYDDFLPRVGRADLADALASQWTKAEIGRMFPSMENAGPLGKLLNEFAPFLNYQFKNSILWITEAIDHPALVARANQIGAEIEKHNLREWAKQHPEDEDGSTMPAHLRNRIALPGAPDVFLDLTALTDIGRGVRLLSGKEQTGVDHLSNLFRAVSPAPLAVIRGILDHYKVGGTWKWEDIKDANGFPTGGVRRVYVPLGEPWSGDPVGFASVIWPLDLFDVINSKGADGTFDTGDIYQVLGKLTMYSEFARANPVEFQSAWYFELRGKDPEAAKAYLKAHPAIKEYWKSRQRPEDSYMPLSLRDWHKDFVMERDWWQNKTKAELLRIDAGRDEVRAIRNAYDRLVAEYANDPLNPAIRELEREREIKVNQVYLDHPELIEADVLAMAPADWAKKLDKFETDALIQQFFAMDKNKPERVNFKSQAEFEQALADYETQRGVFIKAYPTVEDTLSRNRGAVEKAMDDHYEDWARVWSSVSARRLEAEKAVLAGEQGRADLLYGINELERATLEEDMPVWYFTDKELDDMAGGAHPALRGMKPGLGKLPPVRAILMPDWAQNKWNKATPAERLKITADNAAAAKRKVYSDAVGAIVDRATVNGVFDPIKFVEGMQAAPKAIRDEYFRTHPGKEKEWADNDLYFKRISAWGAAKHAGNFAEADRLWNAMPKWMQDRYFYKDTKDPAKRAIGAERLKKAQYNAAIAPWGKAIGAKNYALADKLWARMPQWVKDRYYNDPVKGPKRQADAAYGKAMKTWASYFTAGNWGAANVYFAKLPSWIKSRYLSTHPGKKGFSRGGSQATSAYVGAMQKWISYMDKGDYAGAQKFFDGLPKSVKDRYYNHPTKGAERRQQRDYGNYMGKWVALVAKGDSAGADDFFESMPKWVKDKYYGDPEKGAERRQTRSYIGYMEKWTAYLDKEDYAGAEKYFNKLPKWAQDRYYNDPKKGAERKQTREFGTYMETWTNLIGAEKFDQAEAYFNKLPKWAQDRYFNDPVKGPERRKNKEYGDMMEGYVTLIDKEDFDGARAYFDRLPRWAQDKYYNDPEKGAERRQNRAYGDAIGQWGELVGAEKFDEADAVWAKLPKWVKDRYYNDPEKGAERRATKAYGDALDKWSGMLDQKDFDGAKSYFDKLPLEMRQKYFAKHPQNRGEGDTYKYRKRVYPSRAPRSSYSPRPSTPRPSRPGAVPGLPGAPTPDRPDYPSMPPGRPDSNYVDLARLDAYFRLPMEDQADYLLANPDIAQYLSLSSTDDQRYRFAVMNGLQQIPKEDAWLRRVYREKYPEVFDPGLAGQYRQRKIASKLAKHPEFQPAYEKYFNAINTSYAESLKRHGVPPRVQKEQRKPWLRRREEEGRPAVWTSAR